MLLSICWRIKQMLMLRIKVDLYHYIMLPHMELVCHSLTLYSLSLFLSPLSQHVDVAALLIKYNSVINATDRWNYTPLHEAAQKGRTQVCSLLVSQSLAFTSNKLYLFTFRFFMELTFILRTRRDKYHWT